MPMILVAEDDAPGRTLICRILSREGFDVLCPPSRRIALGIAAAHPESIDLLAAGISETGLDVTALGNAVLISKPFKPSALVRKVKGLLRRRTSGRSAGARRVERSRGSARMSSSAA